MTKLVILISLISAVFPCAVCYGAPDHPVTQGINNAIMFLLFIVSFVLTCIASSIYILMKRTKALEIKRSNK
tara:strand:+ start:48 stop:263 length:216 start_codon:yes stop_codon:yes gene_type:complete